MRSDKVEPTPCSSCGATNDGAANLESNEGPGEGDISICAYCGNLAIFQADLTTRPLTDEERAEILADERVIDYLAKLMEYHNK